MHLAMGEWIELAETEVDKRFKAEETVESGALSQSGHWISGLKSALHS